MELDKIYNMDAFDGMKQIPDKSVNLAIIDPPYNIGFVRAAFHFDNCDPSGTRLLRIDNLEFNQKILQCSENAKAK